MKFIVIALVLHITSTCSGQNKVNSIYGFWQNINEESIINYYDGRTFLTFLYSEGKKSFSGGKYPVTFGFYNSCDVPNVDSLKSSGTYYFEIDEDEINDDGSIEDYDCLELSFSEENGEEYMNIYRSSQQQFATYRKLKKLPKDLEAYLKKEHPEIYKRYNNL